LGFSWKSPDYWVIIGRQLGAIAALSPPSRPIIAAILTDD
jgi:hypothetical protein